MMKKLSVPVCILCTVLAVLIAGVSPKAAEGISANVVDPISRVSVASDWTQGDEQSTGLPSISANGRFIAFNSLASTLVENDTNKEWDIFVRDLATEKTERISVASDGSQANWDSFYPSISANGRYVSFRSGATNLVPDDNNGTWDIFVHNRQTGHTELVSVANDGTQSNDNSYYSSISFDGRFVAFSSLASNLIAEDKNETWDVFVHDRETGSTECVSIATDGTHGNNMSYYPSISYDGRYIAFESLASNLVVNDSNSAIDIFIHDRVTGVTQRMSVTSDGSQGNGDSLYSSISSDGRYVAFESLASNLVLGDSNYSKDVFVHDRLSGLTERVSLAADGTKGNGASFSPAISADGRFVAFESSATNLVEDDTNNVSDIFLRDRQSGSIALVSLTLDSKFSNATSSFPTISANGALIAFPSDATNLVLGDTNIKTDIFVRGMGTGTYFYHSYLGIMMR